jgi:16S rRNA (uracil1498-N3)-methyltransferase
MPRFFAEIIDKDSAIITGKDARHIKGPLRKKAGDELFIRDHSMGYTARISSISSQKVDLEILYSQELSERSAVRVYLGMSLIDLKDMDQIIRVVTELGVSEIYPLIAERSNIRSVSNKRIERWRCIVKEAVKQCERRVVPCIHEPAPIIQFIRKPPVSWKRRLVASLNSDECIYDYRDDDAGILIGPEGGFTSGELETICARGFIPVNMGSSVLRSVTAAITAVGVLGM